MRDMKKENEKIENFKNVRGKEEISRSNNADDRTKKAEINCSKNSDNGIGEYTESTTILNGETEAASCQTLQF